MSDLSGLGDFLEKTWEKSRYCLYKGIEKGNKKNRF